MPIMTKRTVLATGLFFAAVLATSPAVAQDEGDRAPAASPAAGAASADEEGTDEPIVPAVSRVGEEQRIGLYFTSINKIDPTKNTWEFDAILYIETKGKLRKCDKKQVQNLFPDGELKKVDEIQEEMDGDLKSRTCKVTVEESSDIDISRFPFDRPSLSVYISDEGDSAEGVVFKPLEKESVDLSPKATLPGWVFGEPTAVAVKANPAEKQPSAVIIEMEAHRPLFSSFVKAFLAVLLQLIISGIGLYLPMKVIANRLTLTTAALIAVAATHSTISGQINVPYLTTTDKFFMATYLTLAVNLMFTVLLMRADDQKKEEQVKRLSSLASVFVPAIGLLGVVVVLVGLV